MKDSMLIKNEKGITLVEIMVGLLIFSIVTTIVIMIMYPTLSTISKTKQLAEYGMIADDILSEISNDIRKTKPTEKIGEDSITYIQLSKIDESDTEFKVLSVTTTENLKVTYIVDQSDKKLKRNYNDEKDSENKFVYNDVLPIRYYDNMQLNIKYEYLKDESNNIKGCKVIIQIGKTDRDFITREYAVVPPILAFNS